MVKIKTTKQLNLPQLIEYAWDNNVKNERYRCSDSNPYEYVWINENSDVELDEDMSISKNDTFTVEVEEEVNGETILDRLYEVYFDGLKHDTNMFTNTTTNSLITSKTALIYTVIDNQVIVLWEKYTGGFR